MIYIVFKVMKASREDPLRELGIKSWHDDPNIGFIFIPLMNFQKSSVCLLSFDYNEIDSFIQLSILNFLLLVFKFGINPNLKSICMGPTWKPRKKNVRLTKLG